MGNSLTIAHQKRDSIQKETCQWGKEPLEREEERSPAERRRRLSGPLEKRRLARKVSPFDGTAMCIFRRFSTFIIDI